MVRQKMRGGEALQYNFKGERVVPGGRQGSAWLLRFAGRAERGHRGICLQKTLSFPVISLQRKAGIAGRSSQTSC